MLTQEETAETIVPDYCPDIARIISAEGTVYLHGGAEQEGLSGTVGVTVLYTDGTVCSLAGEEILAVTESGGWAITQNEGGEPRLAVAWYAPAEEGNVTCPSRPA